VLVAAVAWGIGGARAALLSRRARLATKPADLYYGLPPAGLRIVALRYREALADLLWVRGVLYFGLSDEFGRTPKHIDLHMEAVLALDPDFERAYSTAAALTQYRPVPKRVALEQAVAFMERGAKRFPDEWRFPFFAGAYMLEIPADDPAELRRLRLRAADWVQRAALLGAGRGAPDWLPNLAATVLSEAGQREMALRYLEEMLLSAPDEATRAQVRAKIGALRSRVEADRLAAEAERFFSSWRANYPYLPGDLFVLVGEKPKERAIDLRGMIESLVAP
jgi:hypothetical protein